MAGRRRQRQAREVLVGAHDARSAVVKERLLAAAGQPTHQVAAAADYLRGAISRTSRDVPAEGSATAREAVRVLIELGDQLFRTAIEKRRSRS
jgi:hypothetical protein